MSAFRIQTIQQAYSALDDAYQDTLADRGEEVAEAAYFDLVRIVADDCAPSVKKELLRREGLS